MHKITKIISITFGVLFLLLFAAHLILTYRSKEILKAVVNELTNGKYVLKTKSVKFTYYPIGIKIKNAELLPTKQDSKSISFTSDFIKVKLRSVWGLITNNRLEVELLQVNRPSLVTYAKNKSGTDKKGIAESIKEIQDNLFKAFNVLKVKQSHIKDASLKIYSSEDNGEYFFINHINIDLANISFKKRSIGPPKLKGQGEITIKNPTIHLVDSSVLVSMGSLKANSLTSDLEIDSLYFIQQRQNGVPEEVQFSKLSINNFKWQRLLNEGVFEIDSLIIAKGSANLSFLENEKNKKKPFDFESSSLYNGNSFFIHYVAISDIFYQLSTKDIINSNNELMLMKLKADSFVVKEMSLINGRKPALSAEALNLKIKDFSENDESNDYAFSLRDISISNKQLLIKDFQLLPGSSDKWGNDNKLVIPEIKLENYSLEEILQKKLHATKITITNPELVIDILKKTKAKETNKIDINQSINDLMSSVSKKVKLVALEINNASIRLLPQNSPTEEIKLSGFSLLVNGKSLTKATSAMDIIRSIDKLNTNGFTISNAKMKLKVTDLKLLDNSSGLYFGSVQGNSGENAYVDFKGVTILNKNNSIDFNYFDGLHLSDLVVDSGSITILNKKNQSKNNNTANQSLKLVTDHLKLNNVIFNLQHKKKFAVSSAINLEAYDFQFFNKEAQWSQLGISSSKNKFSSKKIFFDAGNLSIIQPGKIEFLNTTGKFSNGQNQFSFATEKLQIGIGISSSKIDKLELQDIYMVRPYIKADLSGKQATNVDYPKKEVSSLKPVSIKKLVLDEPSFEFKLNDSVNNPTIQTKLLKGNLTLNEIKIENKAGNNLISAKNGTYFTSDISNKIADKFLNPASMRLAFHNILITPAEKLFQFHLDTANFINLSQTIIGKKNDTINLNFDSLSITDFPFSNKDSINWKSLIKKTNWWLTGGNMSYLTPKQTITVTGLNLSNNTTMKFELDSFSIVPRGTREKFWLAEPYEKTFLTLHGGHTFSNNLQLDMIGEKPTINIGQLYTKNINIKVERDKTRPEDTITYRPLLARQLQMIPFPVKIDTVYLQNCSLEVNEISRKTAKQAQLEFKEINGFVHNIKNYDLMPKDSLVLRVKALMYGTENLRLRYRQSYTDTLQGFWIRVKAGKINMKSLNRFLTPLIGLHIKSGMIDSLLLVANGNDYFGYGTMDLRYHSLSIKYADTSRSKLILNTINWLASKLLRKHDNGRSDLLYKNRLRKRGVFNFWGKLALEGFLTNIGVRSNKKEQKDFKKNIKKYNLPATYWDKDDN